MKIYIGLIFQLFALGLFAQTKVTLTGSVSDSTHHPLQMIAVFLLEKDSVIQGTYTDEHGHYEMRLATNSVYQLKFQRLNEVKWVNNVATTTEKIQILDIVFNHLPVISLPPIDIREFRKPIICREGREGSTVYGEEIIHKMSKCKCCYVRRFVFDISHLADRRLIAPARFMPQVYVPIK